MAFAAAGFVSRDHDLTLVTATFDADVTSPADVAPGARRALDGISGVKVGGWAAASAELSASGREDLARGELIALPLIALIMLYAFRNVLASCLAVTVGERRSWRASPRCVAFRHFSESTSRCWP